MCNFSSERISGLRVECLTQTSAVLRGWIYGEGADPAIKYTALLQQAADNKAVFTLGNQKVTKTAVCVHACVRACVHAALCYVIVATIVLLPLQLKLDPTCPVATATPSSPSCGTSPQSGKMAT